MCACQVSGLLKTYYLGGFTTTIPIALGSLPASLCPHRSQISKGMQKFEGQKKKVLGHFFGKEIHKGGRLSDPDFYNGREESKNTNKKIYFCNFQPRIGIKGLAEYEICQYVR